MIHNGRFFGVWIEAGGVNAYGEPCPASTATTEAIPCQATAVTDNRSYRTDDGEMHQASYRVLVEGCDTPLYQRIRLQVDDDPEPREYRVLSARRLSRLGRTEYTV